MLSQRVIDLLEARGISAEIASNLGWRDSGNPAFDLEIPYFRGEEVVNRKYRTLEGEKRFSQDKGGEQCLYNLAAIDELGDSPLIITEGEMDCAIALQCGHMAVSVPGGAPSSPVLDTESRKYDYLHDVPPDVTVIICADGDGPGAALLHDLSLRLGRARCKWVRYPKNCKDLNDTFLQWGEKGVNEAIRRAEFVRVDGVYRMSELPPALELEAIPCPVAGLGENYKIRLGDFTVITGIPGYGKTTLANEISAEMAKQHGWKIAVASFEQSPQADHKRNLRTLYHGRPAYLQTPEELAEADAWIDRHFVFIVPEVDDDVTLGWCKERCVTAILRHGCQMVIIDPWNEMDHLYPSELTLTQYTGYAIKELKKMARKYLVHVAVVAHPAKLQRNKEGNYPVPSLYDVSDSSHWHNKPDIGIIVHKEDANSTLIRVAKIRYWGIIGKPGDIKLQFDDYSHKYRSLS